MPEGRSGVLQMGSYLCYPGLSERGNFVGGSTLIPYLVVLLVSYDWQYIYLRCVSFEIDGN